MSGIVRGGVAVTLALAGADALACGGMFCDQGIPRDTQVFDTPRVDQSAERIVFAIDEEAGKVDVHVQVSVTGEVDAFAWVVPVPAVPELYLSTQALFDGLDAVTAPQFQLLQEVRGECRQEDREALAGGDDAADFDTGSVPESDANDSDEGGVVVLDQRTVGPYETVTLRGETAEELVDWLQERGFTIPDGIEPSLAPYLSETGAFVALRLTKGATAADLQPLAMRYDGTKASIPITLTRIAAVPDMRLLVWVLGDKRAVPENYLHVQPNLLAVDWWSAGANWPQVITAAANDAGGQAFATDSSVPTSAVPALSGPAWAPTATLRAADNALELLVEVRANSALAADAQIVPILDRFVDVPADLAQQGVTELDLFNCPSCWMEELLAIPVDGNAVADAIVEAITTPREKVQALVLGADRVTRLLSSMSPSEMDIDPIFGLVDGLEAVDPLRTATEVTICSPSVTPWEAPRQLEIEGWPTLPLPSRERQAEQGWDSATFTGVTSEIPNRFVEESTSVEPLVLVADNTAEIAAAIEAWRSEAWPAGTPGVPGADASCGCSSSSGAAPGLAAGIGLMALATLRRRRID